MSADASPQELVGEVGAVVFTNEATGFGVIELDEETRAVGPLAGLAPGQPVRLLGRWTQHPRYGPTFAADSYEPTAPRTQAGLTAFLSSGRFAGVGKTLAERLVGAFGLGLAEIVTTDPQRLSAVRGVSPGLASRIGQAWAGAGALAALAQRLGAAGAPGMLAQRVYARLGVEAGQTLDEDPYRLLEVRGARWAHAEALARAAGVTRHDPRRLVAGAVAAQSELVERHGHTAVAEDDLCAAAGRLLGVDRAGADRALDAAAGRQRLTPWPPDEGTVWYRPDDLAAEQTLANELARLLAAPSRVSPVARIDARSGLVPEQLAAVEAALRSGVSVITGGPGTGKTRTVEELVAVCAKAKLRIALCAPTGRAAKRLEELTGRRATTVHRLLDAQPVDDDVGFQFSYGPRRRLPHDLVVADEWSMADVHLAAALVGAVGDGSHLVLVGDADQLPSVGPGAVLRDLLRTRADASGEPLVPATRLRTIHRQAAASRIVTLAHEINAGATAVPQGRQGDVFTVVQPPDGVAERVAEIVAVRAPSFFGCRPHDVQVLAPMYRGAGGVDALNAALKQRLNPPQGRPAVGGFHEGDRVVATRNDAALDIANGDVGEVAAVDASDGILEVAFLHGIVEIDATRASDLAPAWCLTVHKAQGSEWPVVVLVLDPAHRAMLWRELVYTAVTRAQVGLLLVGDPRLVVTAARRTGSGTRLRRTMLPERLTTAAAQTGVRIGLPQDHRMADA